MLRTADLRLQLFACKGREALAALETPRAELCAKLRLLAKDDSRALQPYPYPYT